jgi:hypothetical protein
MDYSPLIPPPPKQTVNSFETQIPFGIKWIGEKISSFPTQSSPIPKGI